MKTTTLKRIFRAGFLDFWRNGFVSFASISVITFTLVTLGAIMFAGVILNSVLAELKDKADVSVYFTTTATENDILAMKQSIAALPEVTQVEYISAEDELAAFRLRHQNDQLTLQALDELPDNPLGAVLNIRTKELSQYEDVANFLKQQIADQGNDSIVDKVSYFDETHREAITRLESITNSGERAGFIFLALLMLISIAITFNTMRLAIYTARDEIQVMRLVGATRGYIRSPFVVEGVMYGVTAGLVTLIVFYPLSWWLGSATSDFFAGINIFEYYLSHFLLFFVAFIGTGAVLGAVSSFLAVRRYLKI